MKKLVCVLLAVVGMTLLAADPVVRNVIATPRNPWGKGKVEVSFVLDGDLAAGLPEWNRPFFSLSATDRTTGSNYVANASALSGDTGTAEGLHHVVWDLKAQGLDFVSDDVVFTATYSVLYDKLYDKYCVIDLSAGANATTYPVSYLSDVPEGGWTDEYKTTKMVLRLIEPGAIPTREATITKPFYIGVFEVTQKQYELVAGGNPSAYKGDMRPVERVSWNMVRGNSSTYNWPSTTDVDPNSFAGRIQTRTGINFDLPTEAQWEYACRAGTTSAYNNGADTENDLKALGRYRGNTSDGKGGYSQHTTVGSYLPNAWGLYDMHGNAWEWCLGWYGGSLSGNDPVGPSSGAFRVVRGGSWYYIASNCASSYRSYGDPSSVSVGSDFYGFRLVRALSELADNGEICSCTSMAVSVDSRVNPVVNSVVVTWDASWVGGDANATVVIADNGTEIKRTTGAGEFEYTLLGMGRHELTYTTYIDGVAQDEVYTATVFKDWKYDVVDGAAVITATAQTSGAVEIPHGIDGYTVSGIAAWVFAGCNNLEALKIPGSVYDIGKGAFANCAVLRRVEVAKTLKRQIESRGVFGGCPGDMEIVYVSPEIRNVVATPRNPWGKIEVSFDVEGDLTAGLPMGERLELSLSAIDRTTGSNYVANASALSGDTEAEEGLRNVMWDLNLDGIELKSDDVVFLVAYNYQGQDLICIGDSTSVSVDSRFEPVLDAVTVVWNAALVGGDANATVVIADNGTEVKRTTGAGEFEYTPPNIGRHELTYTTYIDGVAQDEVYTATVFKDWKYEAIGGGAVIVESVHEKGDVELPSEIDGYPVIGTWDSMKISLGDPFCFVDPNEASGYAELCNGSDWIDCWADGEDWAVVPIDGADAGDELVPVIVYGSADESMVSDVHIEDEATFKARLNAAENVECDVESTSRTTPEEIESFVASRRWLMVKINRIDGEFEPKTFFVGLKGGVEYRKFVIVCEDSDGAKEDGFDDAAEAVALPLPVGSAIVSGNGVGARTVSVMPNADMKVLGWSDDDMDTSMERNLMPDGNPYFVVMVARSVGDVLGGAWTSGVEGESAAVIQADDTAEDGVSVRFSAGDDASVWVETIATNACRVSFDWKCSCEGLFKGKPYDYLAFFVDGERKGFICGETDWTNSTFHVEGAGEHRLRWTFIRDDEGSAGEDSAWLANVSFVPSVSVSFNGGGATEGVVPEPMSAYADEGVVLPEPGSLAWPRHRFLGWSDGDTTYVAGDFYPCGGVLELTAVWEAKTLSAPVITAPAAYEADSATVTITSEEGTSIYYTIDGSTPSADGSGSRLCQGAFEVVGSATIRAVAVRDDYFDSEVAEFAVTRLTWTFGEYLNWPGQEFDTGGDAEWTRAKGVSDDGYALRSGVITHSQTSRLETVVSGAGTIQFSCRVEGEIVKKTVYDGLAFCIDGVQQGDLMGNTAWAVKAFEVSGNGSHTISWLYVKDEEGDGSGDDCAWIDNISWTPSGSIPAVAGDADASKVNATVDEVGFADAAVKAAIGGSAEEYNALKTWAGGVKGTTGDALAGEAAVVANEHAAAAYLLGAERLFENEPTVEIGELGVVDGESAGTTAMTVAVTVKDGENAVKCVAEKVAAMFEATSDLGDWTGAAKLTPMVTTSGTDANGKMTFVVTPGDGTASKAFLRIKR